MFQSLSKDNLLEKHEFMSKARQYSNNNDIIITGMQDKVFYLNFMLKYTESS